MATQIVLTIFFLVSIGTLLVFTESIYRRLSLKGELTRKFAHFTATLTTISFPYLFNNHWYVLLLALVFFLVLFLSRKGTLLKSIHDIDRDSIGSYLLPISIYITFLLSDLYSSTILFTLPILILAICDPAAGILGLNFNKKNGKIRIFGKQLNKTYAGSTAFLISCFLISLIALYRYRMVFDLKTFWLAVGISITGTLAEMLSVKGLDNLFIPLTVLLMLLIFL